MSSGMEPMGRVLSPLAAALVATVGAIIGGTIYVSVSGALLGLLFALAVLAIVIIILDALGFIPGTPVSRSSPSPASNAIARAIASPETAMTNQDKTVPNGAPNPAEKIDATETEAQLLNSGRFAEYHLVKAKRLFEAKNFKEAAYQAAASLAHEDLPEAKTLRQTALAAAR